MRVWCVELSSAEERRGEERRKKHSGVTAKENYMEEIECGKLTGEEAVSRVLEMEIHL